MWFIYALATVLLWGGADLFYKKGADEADKYSHLKTAMAVGLIMGLHAICTLIFGNIGYDFLNVVIYMPVSLCYILSMTVGYFGLRYLELSVSSPIQNSSGAIVSIMCLLILGQTIDLLSSVGVILICIGIFTLGLLEKHKQDAYETQYNKKYKIGLVAFLMPIIYCLIDSLGTFLDAYYLDDFAATPLLNVSAESFEQVANTSYELTFFLAALVIFFYLRIIKKQPLAISKQKDRLAAAMLETAGQFTYVFAMSGNGVVAAPMIASYSFVSILLSRLLLKERLSRSQYLTVAVIMLGIIALGIAEGLA